MSEDTKTPPPRSQMVGSLDDLIEQSKARFSAMSEEERHAMWQAQRESFVRAMTTPCEHGVLDFEQCPQCREIAAHPVVTQPDADEVDEYQEDRLAEGMSTDPTAYPDWKMDDDAETPMVKALDWKPAAIGHSQSRGLTIAIAATDFIPYRIVKGVMGFFTAWLGFDELEGVFDQPDQAKAAAQADYEARIRAALSAPEGNV